MTNLNSYLFFYLLKSIPCLVDSYRPKDDFLIYLSAYDYFYSEKQNIIKLARIRELDELALS